MADIQVTNTDADLSDNTLLTEENAYTITGLHTFSRSTNAPFAVNSGAAVVANLDADKLDGQQGSYYIDPTNLSSAVAVNKGGTGATSLTDGGVLLGSGTSAVTAMAVLADGEMIVGDGTTDPVAESGATLRTSIGVGTGDSPQFTGIELGHATDTTLTKASSGDVNIEGNIIYRAGGTDVPVADGGTGASSLTDGGILLGSGTSAVTAMAVLADGEMIVGDGSTDPVAESGATLRTSIGVGTGDSPTFTAVTVGQADITAEGDLRLQDASGGEYVGLDAPATVSSSYTLTLPAAIGSVNQMLTINNTDGTLQWASASSTSAAGSDTQVQYNDGGSSFGGDAGLVYNDSTNVLTAGKLATTDTSATSIDVAGGITAGTGNVAIVNAAGKIPALSSTYLADLSGANLTGISAGGFPFLAKASLTSGRFESGTLSLAGSGLLVVYQNIECDTDNETPLFEINNVTSSSYKAIGKLWRSDGNVGHNYDPTYTYALLGTGVNPQGRLGNAAGEQMSGYIYMSCDGTYVQWYGLATCLDPSALPIINAYGGILTASSITDISIFSSGGNLDSGEVMFYNIAES